MRDIIIAQLLTDEVFNGFVASLATKYPNPNPNPNTDTDTERDAINQAKSLLAAHQYKAAKTQIDRSVVSPTQMYYCLQIHYLNTVYYLSTPLTFILLRAYTLLLTYADFEHSIYKTLLSQIINSEGLSKTALTILSKFHYDDWWMDDGSLEPGIARIKECLVKKILALADVQLKIKALIQALFLKDSLLGVVFDRGKWFNLTRFTDGSKKQLADELAKVLDSRPQPEIDANLKDRFQAACKSGSLSIGDIEKHPELYKALTSRKLIPDESKKGSSFWRQLFSSPPAADEKLEPVKEKAGPRYEGPSGETEAESGESLIKFFRFKKGGNAASPPVVGPQADGTSTKEMDAKL